MLMAITGDMHSINKANFAILHWLGRRFEARFTDLQRELKELYGADTPAAYEKCQIQPTGQINLQVIINEKPNIDRIVATLGLKEITQGTLIRKLCTYTTPNPTPRAIFEYDKLIRSIYTLRHLRDPQLERTVHRSQNRINLHGLRYIDLTLAAYVGEDVVIRYDPRDMAEIRVFYQEQFLCRAVCQELAAQSISLKDIIRVRTERRRQLRAGLSERAALVDALIAVHREPDLVPIPAPAPVIEAPKAPPLKRYYNE